MDRPFVIHDGTIAIKQKITRNKISISVLEKEHEIHNLEQQKGKIYQKSIIIRINLIKEMNQLEGEQVITFSKERMNEINTIIGTINNGCFTGDDHKNMMDYDSKIKALREEITELTGQFMQIDSMVAQTGYINVIQGKIHIPSFEEDPTFSFGE